MFFFGSSPAKEAREQAAQLLLMADKVDAYRCDVVSPKNLAAMRAAAVVLRKLREDKNTPVEILNRAAEVLHETMLPCGGDIYPVTFLGDNVEMVLACAILFVGIRTFFLSPFQIPTNSMYPTYSGMTPYNYELSDPGPGLAQQAWNLFTLGASHYDVRAPADGEVLIPVKDHGSDEILEMPKTPAKIRNWSRLFLLPVDRYEYTLLVGGQPVKVYIPLDFDRSFEMTLFQTYFKDIYAQADGDIYRLSKLLHMAGYVQTDAAGASWLRTGRMVHAGDKVLNFDIRAGDMLFVDRFSYNFIAPKPGDPFVFHTINLPLAQWLGNRDVGDQYYIKRLVGVPGDELEIRPPALYRNGAPITGARAFELEANREDGYPGYVYPPPSQVARGALAPGQVVEVPAGHYFAMGDNSPESLDSRYWGGVPAQNVVGRAIFILYPFTHRWGPAH